MRFGRRRVLCAAAGSLASAAASSGAAADGLGFPATANAAGRALALNGAGTRRWYGVEVYRAALYLERRTGDADAVLRDPGARLIVVRYRRAVPEEVVRTAWDASHAENCGCAPSPSLLRWVRPIAAGDEERYAFDGGAAVLVGPGRGDATLAAPAGTDVLRTWIGPVPPTAALKRGLLGHA